MTSSPPPRPNPIAGVSVLVVYDGRVLLVKRGREPNRGLWALPGGRIEPGESAQDAAVREAAEETGVAIEGLREIDIVEVAAEGAGQRYTVTVFDAHYRAGVPRAGDDAAEVRWVGLSELAGLPLTEGTRAMLAGHGAPDSA